MHRIQQPAGASIVAQWRHHRFFWHSRRLPTKWAARTRPSTTSCDAAGPPIGRLGERIQTWKIRVHSEPRASNSRPRPAASRHGLEPDTARGFFVNKAPLLINTNNQNFMTRSSEDPSPPSPPTGGGRRRRARAAPGPAAAASRRGRWPRRRRGRALAPQEAGRATAYTYSATMSRPLSFLAPFNISRRRDMLYGTFT